MFLQLGVELAPMLDILLCHFQKLGCPGFLLLFGALTEIELESGSMCADFLACWWEENEVPLFLVLGDWVLSKVVLDSSKGCAGLHNLFVLLGLHSVMDILWQLLPIEENRCIICLIS